MVDFWTMSSADRQVHYTYEEYAGLEEESSIRHEYLDGEIYAMAGGTPDHAALAAAVIGLLRAGIPQSCRIFTSDLHIRTSTGLSTYPDAAVVWGKTLRAADDPIAVTNPCLLVELTSPSTEDYDRGEKLRHYKSISSLREIVIVSHRETRMTVYRKDDGEQWSIVEARTGDSVKLASLGATLTVDNVYLGGLEDVG
jgi:Uma2 family endonuclease